MTAGIIVAATADVSPGRRIGIRLPLIVGPGIAVGGMLWMTRLTPTSHYVEVLGPLVLIALGMGFAFVPLTLTAVSRVEAQEAGLASALLNTMQQVGGALGLAVLATIAIDARNSKLASLHSTNTVAQNIATTHGYTTAFLVSAGIAAIALLIAIVVVRAPEPLEDESLAPAPALL
jgi:hypothetical protein